MILARRGPVVGIGVDVVELDRFRHVLARTPTLVERVFTPAEQAYARARTDPTERFAVRFAAKEAVLKALGLGLGAVRLEAIEVVRAESGAPGLHLHDEAAEQAAHRGVVDWALTLTHSHRSAYAVAVAFGPALGVAPDGAGGALRLELWAPDPQRTVAFYEDVLGFTAAAGSGGADVRLRAGAVEVDVVRAAATGDGPHGRGVRLVLEVDDLDAAWRRAARHVGGLAPPGPPSGPRRDFGVVDPDGVHVRVTERAARLAP